jgi:hypothetical protein
MRKLMNTDFRLDNYYSWFGTTTKIPFAESVLNNEDLLDVDFNHHKINDQIDLINLLDDHLRRNNEAVYYVVDNKLPTEVLYVGSNIIHTPLTLNLPFSKLFNLIIGEMFNDNQILFSTQEELDNSLQTFLATGKSFKFQIIFCYRDFLDVLQNTWIDPTTMEYLTNQSPINTVLKSIVNVGPDTFEDGKYRSPEFPIVSPVFVPFC